MAKLLKVIQTATTELLNPTLETTAEKSIHTLETTFNNNGKGTYRE